MPIVRPLIVVFATTLVSASVSTVFAQTPGAEPQPEQHEHHSSLPLELFPLREASGTAWQPEMPFMYGVHRTLGLWQVMLHGNVFAQYVYEPGDRHRTGGSANSQLSSVNWAMLMARRSLGQARFGLRGMLSAEPWTVSDCGYLNFLATGEICDGDTIHDRQHPHDLFMELSADYDRPLRGSLRWQIYGGLAGEPALGPGGFPHRLSALSNPVAPISHHWLDSTHITFGLVTTGVYGARWKAETSVFNGREPDTNRADIDFRRLDSFSGRVSMLPTKSSALQISAAHLHEAEAGLVQQPRIDVDRLTASATYHRALSVDGMWATTIAFGVNAERELIPGGIFDAATSAGLVETALSAGRHTWFSRAEVVAKPAHDLHAHEYGADVFAVGKLQSGYERQFGAWRGLSAGVGAWVAASILPAELAPRYSGRVAPSFGVFFSARPAKHVM
jgi:hypothetical protein